MSRSVFKKVLGLIVLIISLFGVLYFLGNLTPASDEKDENTLRIEKLEAENRLLKSENDNLEFLIQEKEKQVDRLTLIVNMERENIENIEKEKDEKVSRIASYDVDALYEFFSRFNSTNTREE